MRVIAAVKVMENMRVLFFVAVFCLVFFFSGFAQQDRCSGVFLGVLPTYYHNVSGVLFVEDEFSFCIENFTYDGHGLDAFLYFSIPGYQLQNTGGGVIINITTQSSGSPQFDVGVPHSDEAYRFTLPNKTFRACDFEGFGIWCRYANLLFTNIIWNSTAFSANGTAGTVQCVPSPGRGFVGELSTEAHGVAGDLYIRDNKTFVIRNFRYDGGGPDTFVYWYAPGVEVNPAGGGNIIPLTVAERGPEGEFDNTVYDANYTDDFVITIPDDVNIFTCDAGTFTIWCRQFTVFFSRVSIDLELFTNNPLEAAYEPNRILCDRPTTQPGVLVGELPDGGNPRAISGTFYVKDQYTFVIQLFSYNATAWQNTVLYYYRLGEVVDKTGGGQVIPQSSSMETFGTAKSDSIYNQDLIVNLRLAEVKACQISFFTIYARDDMEHITQIAIPQGIFTDNEGDVSNTKVFCGASRLVMKYAVAALFAILSYSLS